MLTVHIEHRGEWMTIRPRGDLDAATAAVLRTALNALPTNARAEIDLGGVPFVDSAGLAALLAGIRRLTARGKVVIREPQASVGRLLRTTGVDGLVPVLGPPAEEADTGHVAP